MPVVNVFRPDGSSGVPSPPEPTPTPPEPEPVLVKPLRPDLMNSRDAARVYASWRKNWRRTIPGYQGVPRTEYPNG